MVKITPDPPLSRFHIRNLPEKLLMVRACVSHEEALTTAYEILDCATATAYECASGLEAPQRKLVLAVVHLLETAKEWIRRRLMGRAGPTSDVIATTGETLFVGGRNSVDEWMQDTWQSLAKNHSGPLFNRYISALMGGF